MFHILIMTKIFCGRYCCIWSPLSFFWKFYFR